MAACDELSAAWRPCEYERAAELATIAPWLGADAVAKLLCPELFQRDLRAAGLDRVFQPIEVGALSADASERLRLLLRQPNLLGQRTNDLSAALAARCLLYTSDAADE